MQYPASQSFETKQLLQQALLRWENEGGSHNDDSNPNDYAPRHEVNVLPLVPVLSNAELVQLQIRVIALENLVVGLLADGSPKQRQRLREVRASISPRPSVEHRLTAHAALHMEHLTRRATRL